MPYVQVKQRMLKVENLIKNILSRLHHIHQRRGLLKTPLNIWDRDICKNSKGRSVINCFCKKTSSQNSGGALNTCYKMVVWKFPIYKLKQKTAKKVKN